MGRVKAVDHQDHLTLVEHLDELRWRLIVAVAAFVAAFAVCFWQNHEILKILNEPLPEGVTPLTIGVTEPFITTLTVSAYAALVVSMPVILYELYAFVLPAFSPNERRVALPLLLMVPVLFISGILFGYFVVLNPAIHFLVNFNDSQFNIQVRARDYYSFVALTLLAMGILFQVPMGILAAVRAGIVTPKQLRKNRSYALLVIAILAAMLPSIDPVTMVLEMVPLLVLYELSIVVASIFGGASKGAQPEPTPEGSG